MTTKLLLKSYRGFKLMEPYCSEYCTVHKNFYPHLKWWGLPIHGRANADAHTAGSPDAWLAQYLKRRHRPQPVYTDIAFGPADTTIIQKDD